MGPSRGHLQFVASNLNANSAPIQNRALTAEQRRIYTAANRSRRLKEKRWVCDAGTARGDTLKWVASAN